MAEENEQITPPEDSVTLTKIELDALVAEKSAEKAAEDLKAIKAKLDSAYSERDKAKTALADKEREAQLKLLEEQGKHKEIFDMQLKERDEKLAASEQKRLDLERVNSELNRDSLVRIAISSLSFKSDKALNVAFADIARDLVQDANLQWVHKSGSTLTDFVKIYKDDEDNSFLFKQNNLPVLGILVVKIQVVKLLMTVARFLQRVKQKFLKWHRRENYVDKEGIHK